MCARDPAVKTSEMSSEVVMPSWPIAKPATTEVIMNPSPATIPTRPLALARSVSGTSSVTTVPSAMLRADSMMAPVRSNTMKAKKGSEPSVRSCSRGEMK